MLCSLPTVVLPPRPHVTNILYHTNLYSKFAHFLQGFNAKYNLNIGQNIFTLH